MRKKTAAAETKKQKFLVLLMMILVMMKICVNMLIKTVTVTNEKRTKVEDTPRFSEYTRMPYQNFIELVNITGPAIQRICL